MKKCLRVMGVSILTVLLAVSLAACKGEGKGGNGNSESSRVETRTISDSVIRQDSVTEWEALTGEVMKLYSSGDYAQAVTVAKRALQVAQQNDGPDHTNVALSLSNLAEIYEAQSEYAKAEQLYKQSLEILEKKFGKDDPFLAPTLLNMASLYNNIGREDEADRLMERANNIQAKQ
jgi:tetratricopeptide (TPR) repeat protein